jgi:hypothetical protein
MGLNPEVVWPQETILDPLHFQLMLRYVRETLVSVSVMFLLVTAWHVPELSMADMVSKYREYMQM